MAHSTEAGGRWCVISEGADTDDLGKPGKKKRTSSLVIFIATCRKRRQPAQHLFSFYTPAAIHYRPGGERLQLADAKVDTRFKNSRVECHAYNLCRRRRAVDTIYGTPRTPERAKREEPERCAGLRPADRF